MFPCKCGHMQNDHIVVYQDMYNWNSQMVKIVMGSYCKECISHIPLCEGRYQPDNLRYLEDKYEKQQRS